MRTPDQAAALVVLLAAPVFVLVALARLIRAAWSCRYAWASQMTCRHCGQPIPLVRVWRCSCGFTYVGSVLRLCPICGTRPVMVRCQACGLTWGVR